MLNLKIFILTLFVLLFNISILANESDKVTAEPKDFETTKYEDEVYDPLEPINRVIFNFNNATDKLILEPVAKGYTKLPNPLQSGISNFLSNLRTPLIALNQVLQGQFKNAADTSGRFLINSTAGFFGVIDVADKIGLEETKEDFGQTLATWGVGDGFYIVLPIFGPSNLRDATGLVMTSLSDPFNAYMISEGEPFLIPLRTATNAIDQRSKIIDEVNALRNNSVDYYAAVKSSYYQNRKAAIINDDDSAMTPFPLISVDFE